MIKLRTIYIFIFLFSLVLNFVVNAFLMKSSLEDNHSLELKKASETVIKSHFNQITQGNFREFIDSSKRTLTDSRNLLEISIFDGKTSQLIASSSSRPVKSCTSTDFSFCMSVNSFTKVYFNYKKTDFLTLLSAPIVLKFVVVYALMTLVLVFLFGISLRYFSHKLLSFVGAVLLERDDVEIDSDYKILESPVLKIKESLRTLAQENQSHVKKITAMEVARKVAHDIKSPLSVLKSLLDDTSIDRSKLLSVTDRITNISNDLLDSSRDEVVTSFDVLERLMSLIEEKKVESKRAIEINCIESFKISCKKSVFDRVISNLLNNALEFSTGSILVTLDERMVKIKDTGRGIPENILKELQLNPKSWNKKSGNGVGLRTAKDFVESLAGELKITSIENQFTEVCLCFFAPLSIVHIDDDELLRLTWRTKCQSKSIHYHGFASYKDFLAYDQSISLDASFYVDYDLKFDEINGIEVLENIFNKGYKKLFLSTGHSEDDFIRPEYICAIIGKDLEV